MNLDSFSLLILGVGFGVIISAIIFLFLIGFEFSRNTFLIGKPRKNKSWREKMIKRIEKERRDFR